MAKAWPRGLHHCLCIVYQNYKTQKFCEYLASVMSLTVDVDIVFHCTLLDSVPARVTVTVTLVIQVKRLLLVLISLMTFESGGAGCFTG